MRNTFINWLSSKASKDPKIVLITADLGYSVVEPFSDSYPNQFVNVGVAEQNMIGVASGLALEGFLPFCYSIGIFPTFRCLEQIRNDIDYHQLPVVICTVGSGVAYGNLGYTHHAIQDIGVMRILPNMTIATPSDPYEVSLVLDWYYENRKPLYLRLHKSGEPVLHTSRPIHSPGVPLRIPHVNDSVVESDTCILSHGWITAKISDYLNTYPKFIDLFSAPLWGQEFSSSFIDFIKDYSHIIIAEDHVMQGGLSSYILEIVCSHSLDVKITSICIPRSVVGKVACESTLISPVIDSLKALISKLIGND